MSRDDITRRYPILSTHWPGLPPLLPWKPLAAPLARIIDQIQVVDKPESRAA